jgi:membrane-associated phospholipid phosphatase
MNALIVAIAQYLLYVLVAAAAVVWLACDRPGKVQLAAEAVAGLALVGIGIWVAAHLHTDPRPFVGDPNSRPLFAHPADNGFPSDHSAAAGLLTALVFRYRRVLGGLVGVGAVLIGWARVAAHVHHAQDVVTGLGMGVLAGVVAIWLVSRLLGAVGRRMHDLAPRSRRRATAGRDGEMTR